MIKRGLLSKGVRKSSILFRSIYLVVTSKIRLQFLMMFGFIIGMSTVDVFQSYYHIIEGAFCNASTNEKQRKDPSLNSN